MKKASKFNGNSIKISNEESKKGYVLEAHVEYPKVLRNFYNGFPFLSKRIKTKKCNNVCHMYEKNKYVSQIRSLKQALNHGIVLKKLEKVIQFIQKA